MRKESFAEFQTRFWSRFESPEVFNLSNFNTLKIAQEGLKVAYQPEKEFSRRGLSQQLNYKARRLKATLKNLPDPLERAKGDLQSKISRTLLLIDTNRSVPDPDGKPVSVYFNRIIQSLPKDSFVYGINAPAPKALKPDFHFQPIMAQHFRDRYGIVQENLQTELDQQLQYLKQSCAFTHEELAQIQAAYYNFWKKYRIWLRILTFLKPKALVFLAHYHNEGLILACRQLGIKTIELQHGLIAEEDIFYVYPDSIKPFREKMLFADHILTYGKHWTEVLQKGSEYGPGQISEIGYYLYAPTVSERPQIPELSSFPNKAPVVILVTGQYKIYGYFNEYLRWLNDDLESKGQNAVILFKPHPNCTEEMHAPIAKLSRIRLVAQPLDQLFAIADIHLSIYSTTLYEANRFGLLNFSLFVEACKDYVEGVLKTGVAKRIDPGQNPLDFVDFHQSQVSDFNRPKPSPYFGKFSPQVLLDLIPK